MKLSKILSAGTVPTVLLSGVTLLVAGCAGYESRQAAAPPVDGEIAVPANYRTWPRFVGTIDKDNGQVREIYINDTGLEARRGDAFPHGTISVMEIHSSRQNSDGTPVTGDDGRLVKDALSKIFVMQKGKGWGGDLPEGALPNGEWVYGAYEADGVTPATSDFTACRGCHAPLADQDYVARYDEHFDTRN